jgi:hypothetical protein
MHTEIIKLSSNIKPVDVLRPASEYDGTILNHKQRSKNKDRLRGRAFARTGLKLWTTPISMATDRLDRNHRDALLNDTGLCRNGQ